MDFNETKLRATVEILNAVVPKSSSPNQLPDVKLASDAPEARVSLGAFVTDAPADVPKLNVLVALIIARKQPVPEPYVPLLVYVKLVASAISKFICPAAVVTRKILAVPKVIDLTVLEEETNLPVVKENPPKFKFPETSVVTPVADSCNADISVVVPPRLLITKPANVTAPLPETVPAEPTMLTVSVL